MEILLVLAIGIMNITCFVVGARLGQKVAKNEKIEIPNLNPVKAIDTIVTEHKQKKEKEAEDEYYKAILHNIDVYDGTNIGQVQVPIRK